ncbi:MAG: replication initiation factor domain-containing protein [Phycisphaerales bacterium JB065]
MSTSKIHPRYVLPGIETQSAFAGVPLEAGAFCTIDWLRGTCHDSRRHELVDIIEDRFGPKSGCGPGAKYFKHGVDWPNGIKISYGHSSDIAMLDIRGERLSLLSYPERVDVLRMMIALGLKITRIDLAIDYMFQNRMIYNNALASCKRMELARLRRYKPIEEFTSEGEPKQKTLALGSRDSPAYLRIYDKGLEQKIAAVGVWERIEAEFKGDRAPIVAQLVAEAAKPEKVIPDLIFGTVDFRIRNGRTELARRPQATWWAELVGDHGMRVRSECQPVALQRWREAFVNSYGRRILELAEAVGRPVGELVEFLLVGVRASQGANHLADELRVYVQNSGGKQSRS